MDVYIWQLNPGHFEYEIWDDIRTGHRLDSGSAPTFIRACECACLFIEQISTQPPSIKMHVTMNHIQRTQEALR